MTETVKPVGEPNEVSDEYMDLSPFVTDGDDDASYRAQISANPPPVPSPPEGAESAPDIGRNQVFENINPETKDDAERFANWLAIPDDARYLRIVLDGISQRLPRIVEIAGTSAVDLPQFCREGVEAWLTALREFNPDNPFMAPVMGASSRQGNPTHGVQKAGQQLYACQPYFGLPTLAGQFDMLQAQVIVAALRSWNVDQQRYFHGSATLVDAAAAGIRHLNDSNLVSQLPADPLSQTEYQKEVAIVVGRLANDDSKEQAALRQIDRLLRRVEDPDDDKFSRDVQVTTIHVDELEISTPLQIRKTVRVDTETYADLVISGMPLEEVAGDVEEFISSQPILPCPPDKPRQRVPSIVELVRNRGYQIAAMERANQRLSGAWSRLRPHEVSAWLHAIFDITRPFNAKKLNERSEGENVKAEAAVQMSVSFWTSRTEIDCDALMLYATREHLPSQGLEKIGYIIDSQQWCVPRLKPKARPLYRDADLNLAEEAASVVLLPVHGATAVLLLQLPAIAYVQSTGASPAFLTPAEQRKQVVQQHYSELNSRTTPTRIAGHLFHVLSDHHGDTAAASLTLGHAHRLSDTALHYANYPQVRLSEDYEIVCSAIYERAFDDRVAAVSPGTSVKNPKEVNIKSPSVDAPDPEHPFIESTNRIGTEICPRSQTQEQLRQDIAIAFQNVAANPGQMNFLVDHHNRFILYTVLMLKVATGYRDVFSPLPRRSDVDFGDRTILISDKDDAASFNSRVLPLATRLADQLIAVDNHLKVLASRIVLTNSTLARDIYEQTGQLVGKPFPYPKTYDRAPPLFFLKASGGEVMWEPIRPTTLKVQLATSAPSYQLPTNANRAYVRNRLLNGVTLSLPGLPGNVVDYFMGHWVRGREPLGRFATLPVGYYIEELRPALNALLEKDGWTVITGCHD